MRMLRVGVDLQSLETPIKILLVTSAISEEGKSTIARNLALVYREAGIDVALIDADLRRQSLSHAFAPATASPGLTGILLGEASPAEAKVAAQVVLPGDGRRRTTPDRDELAFLPGGGPAANPPAILGSPRMGSVLRELAAQHQMLIIDSPPLLPVSDTLPLLSLVDAVVMVGRVKCTRRDAIRRVRSVLAGMGNIPVLGLVTNDIPESSRSYLYGYGGYYTRPSPGDTARAAPMRTPAAREAPAEHEGRAAHEDGRAEDAPASVNGAATYADASGEVETPPAPPDGTTAGAAAPPASALGWVRRRQPGG
jgi:capsular exopolysaccharide synthesis family protein